MAGRRTPGSRPWAALVAALAVAACGSAGPRELPPAAEPARSPSLDVAPAGRVVPVGNRPEGIVADAETGLAAVGLRAPDRLALVDTATGRVVRRVPLPGAPRHLALQRPGGPVLVPTEPADELTTVALPGGATRSLRVGRYPHDATASGERIFVGDERGGTVSVLDGERPAGRFRVAYQPGGVAILDSGRKLVVVSVKERVVELFDVRTLRRLGRAPAGVGPTHVVTDGHQMAYVVDTAGGALLAFHLQPRFELLRRLPLLGGPYGIVFDHESRHMWVTLTKTNEVVELASGSRPHFLRRFPSVRQPNTVAVDERSGRVLVTGKVDGVLQLLDPPPRSPRR